MIDARCPVAPSGRRSDGVGTMRLVAAGLLVAGIAACDAGPPVRAPAPYILSAQAELTRSSAWYDETDIARDARAFLFAQADLYVAGASAEAGGPMAEMLALMGREDLIGRPQRRAEPPRCAAPARDPLDHVRQAAAGKRAVILIEDGNQPRHRAFLLPLVPALAADGFTVYAADALSAGPGRAAFPGVPLITEGVLARDPVYGRLLRQVKASGFEIIEGEGGWTPPSDLFRLTPEGLAARRADMLASRLAGEVFDRPGAPRVIVHLSRNPGQEALARLEERIEAATGKAPLSVQMTDCHPPEAPRAPLPAGPGEEGLSDIRIGEPVAAFRQGRPTWRRQLGDREVAVPEGFLGHAEPVILEVRREGETSLAVPEDRLLLLPGENLPLMLPPGRYRLEGWTRSGAIAVAVAVSVG